MFWSFSFKPSSFQTFTVFRRCVDMKYLALIIIAGLMLGSCSQPATKVVETTTENDISTDTDSAIDQASNAPVISSLCFLRTEGARNQDSTTIELVIKGDTVTGEMNWLPSLKDGRRGFLKGTKNKDVIEAMWTYKQEGITDSMAVLFKLTDDQLTQKPLKTDPKTGRQLTDNTAGYTVMYRSSNSLRAE